MQRLQLADGNRYAMFGLSLASLGRIGSYLGFEYVETGSPLISLNRVVFAANGDGVEPLKALYRPNRYTLRMEMRCKVSAGVRRWPAVLPDQDNPAADKPDSSRTRQ
jgi:hypothetical protein